MGARLMTEQNLHAPRQQLIEEEEIPPPSKPEKKSFIDPISGAHFNFTELASRLTKIEGSHKPKREPLKEKTSQIIN